jgi:hypothetical protein
MRRNIKLLSLGNLSPSTLRPMKVSLIITWVQLALRRVHWLKRLVKMPEEFWFVDPKLADQLPN